MDTPLRDNQIMIRAMGALPLEEYSAATAYFTVLINALSAEVAGKDRVRWQVTGLEYGSATIQVTGYSDEAEAVQRVVLAYQSATKAAAQGEPIPYSDSVRKAIANLSGLINGSIKSFEFHTVRGSASLSGPVPGRLRPAVRESWSALGTVRGYVETISRRKKPYFFLYDNLFDHAVRCQMTDETREMMRGIWGKLVEVTGRIRRNDRDGRPLEVSDIIAIEEIEMLPVDSHRRFRGLIKHDPNLPSPEQRIRQLRDEG